MRKPHLTVRVLEDLWDTLEIGRSTIEADCEVAHADDVKPCERAMAWVEAMLRWKRSQRGAE